MRRLMRGRVAALVLATLVTSVSGAEIKVDLSMETVGKTPKAFQATVGTWVVVQDGSEKVIKVDGAIWKAAQSNEGRMLIENARRLYGTSNEELMDNAKQFANFPVAILNGLDSFTNGTISLKFKTISGDSDRASGILFNVKPNGDWLSLRYNDTENNVALWEFHNGIRRNVKFNRDKKFMLDRAAWHELKMTIDGAQLTAWLDGELAFEYVLGSKPGPGRGGADPNDDLFPEKNPVLQPPVKGRIGLWSKSDSTSYFKDFIVIPK